MAGYFKKLTDHVFDGSYVAAAELANGVFAEIDADGEVAALAAAGDMVLRVREKTDLWGQDALVLDVVEQGADEIYMVENEWDVGEDEYDDSLYTVKAGEFVKMRRPKIGDQLIVSVDSTLYAALDVGDTVNPAANGTVAATT